MLNPTPVDRMVDQGGRLYFMPEMTLERFQKGLADSNPDARAYLLGKMLREARPDDVFCFVSPQQIADAWPSLEGYLGARRRDFWDGLLTKLEGLGFVCR
jgi:hypothetical protein